MAQVAKPYAPDDRDKDTILNVGIKWMLRPREEIDVEEIALVYDPSQDMAYTDLKTKVVLTNQYIPLNLRQYRDFVLESLIGLAAHETAHINETSDLNLEYDTWVNSQTWTGHQQALQVRNVIEDSRINWVVCMRTETRVTPLSKYLSRFEKVVARAWVTTMAREIKQDHDDQISRGRSWTWTTQLPAEYVAGFGYMIGIYGQWYNPEPPLGDGDPVMERLCKELIAKFYPDTEQRVWDDIMEMKNTIRRARDALTWRDIQPLLDQLAKLTAKYQGIAASKILPKPYGEKDISSPQKDVNKHGKKQTTEKVKKLKEKKEGGGGGPPEPPPLPPLPLPGAFKDTDEALEWAQKIADAIKAESDADPMKRMMYK